MVTGFAMGKRCNELRKLPQHILVNKLLQQLDTIFYRRTGVKASEHVLKCAVHVWGDEPFVKGAYVAPSHSEPVWARKAIEECHSERVFFAGEACAGAVPDEDSPCTLHGSMHTGIRAAKKVSKLLGSSPFRHIPVQSRL